MPLNKETKPNQTLVIKQDIWAAILVIKMDSICQGVAVTKYIYIYIYILTR